MASATGGIADNIQGALTIYGSGADTLNVDDTGSAGTKTGDLTSTTLTGLAMGPGGITYYNLALLNISLGAGNDTFDIYSTYVSTITSLYDGTGNDTVNVQTTNGPANIHTQAGTDTVNVGSLTPVIEGGIVDHIQGAITVYGDGNDTLNVDDTGSNYAKTGTLASSSLTGLNMAGINYYGLTLLNVSLGSGGNTLTVASTFPATTTNINLQRNAGVTTITTMSGADFINIGSLAPVLEGGVVNYIQGPLTVVAERAPTRQ